MFISASTLELQGRGRLKRAPATFSRGLQAPRWQSGDVVFFCDVCGTQQHLDRTSEREKAGHHHEDLVIPDGWTGDGDIHLCPDCAQFLWAGDTLKLEFEPGKDDELVEPVLTTQAAAKLVPDENACVHVPNGIRSIGYKAFMYRTDIQSVELPDSLERIGAFAFACSSLATFVAPPRLACVHAKAFLECAKLKDVSLNEGLLSIGAEAFSASSIGHLHLPGSLAYCARNAFRNTKLVFCAPNPTLTISPANEKLFIDEAGALYANTSAGLVLVKMLSEDVAEHAPDPKTRIVFDGAYAECPHLQTIELPDGLEFIGARAFAGCRQLKHVELPDTLESLGSEALACTGIEQLHIPAQLEGLGARFIDMSDNDQAESLHEVSVDPGNRHLFTIDALLCLHRQDGISVLASLQEQSTLDLPVKTISLAPHALVREPTPNTTCLPDTLQSIHPYAFSAAQDASFIVELSHEECGQTHVFVRKPSRNVLVVSCIGNQMDVSELCRLNDYEMLAALDLHEQAFYALERLDCPQYLVDDCRASFSEVLRKRADTAIALFAQAGDIDSIKRMARHGFITADNVAELVDCALQYNNPVVTAFVLDLKQRLFGQRREDFSL